MYLWYGNRDLTCISMPDNDAVWTPENRIYVTIWPQPRNLWCGWMNGWYEILFLYGSFVYTYTIWSTQTLSWFTDLVLWYFFISFLNLYFAGTSPAQVPKYGGKTQCSVLTIFLQRMGVTTILLKKMLTSDTLTLQNPTEGSHGSQLPWHCSSSS